MCPAALWVVSLKNTTKFTLDLTYGDSVRMAEGDNKSANMLVSIFFTSEFKRDLSAVGVFVTVTLALTLALMLTNLVAFTHPKMVHVFVHLLYELCSA